ncbi:MAG: hypothetical protein V3U90_02355 [Dehalococcoidia bacterium]
MWTLTLVKMSIIGITALIIALLPTVTGSAELQSEVQEAGILLWHLDHQVFQELSEVDRIVFTPETGSATARAYPWEGTIRWLKPPRGVCHTAGILAHEAKHFTQWREGRALDEQEAELSRALILQKCWLLTYLPTVTGSAELQSEVQEAGILLWHLDRQVFQELSKVDRIVFTLETGSTTAKVYPWEGTIRWLKSPRDICHTAGILAQGAKHFTQWREGRALDEQEAEISRALILQKCRLQANLM